jgi:hypothetical protein
MRTRYFAAVVGVVYLLVGILGFIPASLSPPGVVGPAEGQELAVNTLHGRLLGLFPVNVLHDLVHVVIGILGIAAYTSFDRARTFARGLAILYAVLTVMGLIPGLNTVFGLVPLYGHDVWLHAVTAAIAAYFGWGAVERTAAAEAAFAGGKPGGADANEGRVQKPTEPGPRP